MHRIPHTAWGLPAFMFFAMLGLNVATGEAGTVSGNFSAGITIGTSDDSKLRRAQLFYTWGAAEISLKRVGMSRVDRLEKNGDSYLFSGERNGRLLKIAVSARTGKMIKIEDLRMASQSRKQ